MQSWRVRPWLVLLVAAGLAVLVPGLVMADDVVVTGNAIQIVGGSRTVTIPSGGSATVSYYIEAKNNDGQQGCNASDGTPATLTFWIGTTQLGPGTTPVAASPSSLTFTACKQGNNYNSQPVTFSSNTPGSYVITVQVSDPCTPSPGQRCGSYDTSSATFTLVVKEPTATPTPTPSDTTPPQITPTVSGTLGNGGWYVSDVTVSWTVTDPESPVTSTSGCGTTTITADTAGTTLTCAATSAGGTSSASVTIKRDATPPQVTCSPPDASSWYSDNVTVDCTASDTTSGLADPADASFTLSTNVAEAQETASAETGSRQVCDQAGNCADAGPYTFKVDRKAPEVNCAPPDGGVWYANDVSVPCTASDGGSGLADSENDASFTLSTEVSPGEETTSAATGSRTVRDAVGNATTVGPYTFKVDRKAPEVNCTPESDPATADGWYGDNVTVQCTASDGGSGLADVADASFALSTSVAEGEERADAQTGSREVLDKVGNRATAGPYIFKVDRKAPEVTLSCPSGQILQNTSGVVATWTSTDGGSGVDGAVSGQIALDTSQVGVRTATLPAGSVRDRVGNESAAVSCTYWVIYRWSGFFRPVDNSSVGNIVWNIVNAGRAVPIKFSLAGFQGMDILSGTPKVVWVPCTNGASDPIDEFASTAGNSSLQYDPVTDQYIYVWKTDRNWAGKCAKLVVTLKDGTSHEAWFRFTK